MSSSLAVISLVALAVAIAIGFFKNMNVGILSIAIALILSVIFGISAKELREGFSSSLFLQMVGISFLFAIINGNGTLKIVANKLVSLVGKNTFLIPFVIFILGFLLCAVGPGAIPTLVIMPVLAIPIAMSAGLNPLLVAVLGQMGVQAGRMSPITPDAAVVGNLMAEQGIEGGTVPLMLCMLANNIIMGIILYVYFKGWKTDPSRAVVLSKEDTKLNTKQLFSLIGLVALVVGVLFFSIDAGFLGFLIGSVLIILGCGEEKKAIKEIPWGVIMMVLGVGILMQILQISGGVDLVVSGLQKVMTQKTAVPFMAMVGALMSLFSSGLGVVFPTLVPTAGGLASAIGVNALELVGAVVVGGTITGLSPISSAGALVLSGISAEENAEEIYPQKKMFVELLAIAIIDAVVLFLITYIGVFGWICR